METPVVFLDIDGVIVVKRLVRRTVRILRTPPSRMGVISSTAVANLNALAARSGATFVVSSTWRAADDCLDKLDRMGVQVPYHQDWRTDADGPCRGAEIARWLKAHGEPTYCVLDDFTAGEGLPHDRLVLVNYKIGLSALDTQRALALLANATVRK